MEVRIHSLVKQLYVIQAYILTDGFVVILVESQVLSLTWCAFALLNSVKVKVVVFN